eukprot:jgi/Mesvir1/26456/Mv16131-RA.1
MAASTTVGRDEVFGVITAARCARGIVSMAHAGDTHRYLEVEGKRLAYRKTDGNPDKTGIIFCGGFASNMNGDKASCLHRLSSSGRAPSICTTFDYEGHGLSSGRFQDGSIGSWYADALAILDTVTHGPQLLVGSSMGAWMALLLARTRPERVASLLLLAPSPDFLRDLLYASFDEATKRVLRETGRYALPGSRKSAPDDRKTLTNSSSKDSPAVAATTIHAAKGSEGGRASGGESAHGHDSACDRQQQQENSQQGRQNNNSNDDDDSGAIVVTQHMIDESISHHILLPPQGLVTDASSNHSSDGGGTSRVGSPTLAPTIPFTGPVHIIHGMEDEVVPVGHAMRVLSAVASTNVTLELVKGGDHRLSTPRDLDRMCARVLELLAMSPGNQ